MTSEQELETHFQQALEALQAGNWPQAESVLRKINENWPGCLEAWYQRGELYQRQGHLARAIDMYAHVLELDPEVQEVYFNLGQIASQQQEHAQALGYWSKALEINADYHEVRLHLILMLARLGHTPEALTQALELLRRAPAAAPLLLEQARELLQRGQLLEASALCQALRQGSQYETARVLLLELRLLHELGLDAEALALLDEMPVGAENWTSLLRALYVPAHYADAAALSAAREALDHRLAQPLKALLPHPLPSQELIDLPRLRGWQLLDRAEAVDAWLSSAREAPAEAPHFVAQEGARQRLVWLLDAASLPWQSLAWHYLAALTRRGWEVQVLLQQDSLRLLLEQPNVPALTEITTLPADLAAAEAILSGLAPQVLLYSNCAGDGLQFWLSRRRLAPLQLEWPARGARGDFAPSAAASLDGIAPLLPVPGPLSSPAPAPELPLLYPLPARGWSPAELAALSRLAQPVLIAATPTELGSQHQLLSRLPASVRGVVWRSQSDLAAVCARVSGLLVPSGGDVVSTSLAASHGLPLWTLSDGAWQPGSPPNPPGDPLPHTSWAVELRHRLTLALKENI